MPDTTETYFRFLDELRRSGRTNMFGAAPYLCEMFALDRQVARRILAEWMETFAARQGRLDVSALGGDQP